MAHDAVQLMDRVASLADHMMEDYLGLLDVAAVIIVCQQQGYNVRQEMELSAGASAYLPA